MEIAITALVGVGAATAWLVLAGVTALVAGRMIHERDVHDRPATRSARRMRAAAVHR